MIMRTRRNHRSALGPALARACCVRFLLGLLLPLLFTANGHASDDSPVVHIRARTRLTLREVEHHGQRGRFSVQIQAQLTDQASAPSGPDDSTEGPRSFDSRRLQLILETSQGPWLTEFITTDHQGQVSHTFSRLPAGGYRLRAQFAGDDLRDPAEAVIELLLDRQPSELGFSLASSHEAGTPLVISGLNLRSRGAPYAGQVSLSVFESREGKAIGAKRAQQIVYLPPDGATTETGETNKASVRLFLSPPLSAGSTLIVRGEYVGDLDTAPSVHEREAVVITQAQVTLASDVSDVAQGSRLRLSGSLFVTSANGPAALSGELIDIEATQALEPVDTARPKEPTEAGLASTTRPPLRRLLGTALSDENGRFVLELQRVPLRAAPTEIIAKVVPARRYIRPAVSNELHLNVLPPEPVSLLPFLLPLLCSLGIALLLRLAPWLRSRIQQWLQARRARQRAERALTPGDDAPTTAAAARSPQAMIGSAGVALAPRSPLSLRRTVDTTLDGTVFDAAFGQALPAACVIVTPLSPDPATQQRATECDAEGRFVLSQLRAGRCVVRVTASGYQPQEFAASIPHRGELRGITVRLLPLRIQLLADWQRVALAFYGDAALVQTRTPQDLLRDAVAPQRGTSPTAGPLRAPVPAHALVPLRRLTELVEEGYYSGRVCSEAMLKEGQQLAATIAPHAGQAAANVARADAAPRPMQ